MEISLLSKFFIVFESLRHYIINPFSVFITVRDTDTHPEPYRLQKEVMLELLSNFIYHNGVLRFDYTSLKCFT